MGAGRSAQVRLLAIYAANASFFAVVTARGFLVPLIAHDLGADRVTVGLLFTVSTLSAAVLSIPAGFLADSIGRREIVVLSAVLGGLSQLGIALTANLQLYLVMQLLGGLGAGAAQAALYALAVDNAPRGQVGRAMGWMTLSLQVGFLTGPAIAGVIARFTDLRGDLVITTGLSVIPIAAAFLFGRDPHRRSGWDIVTPIRDIIRSRGFIPITVGLFGATILFGTVQAYIPLFGREQLGLPAAQIGYMLAIQAIANGASRVPGGRIVDHEQRKGPIVAIGTAAYAIAVLALPHSTGFWIPTLLLVVGVPFIATAFVALSVSFSTLGPESGRGTAMGFYGAVLFGGLAAGPAIFGVVMQRAGYTAGFSACAITAVALSGAMLVTRARGVRSPVPEAAVPHP
jgi:predicted MFS family arabinose efflux permease